MHNTIYLSGTQQLVIASLLTTLGLALGLALWLASPNAFAADGVVVLQREVPARPAIRDGEPGRAVTVDTSPDDKVKAAVGTAVKPIELDDAGFAAVSTHNPGAVNLTPDTSKLSGAMLNSYGISGANHANPAQSASATLPGAIGGAVGGVANHINAGLSGTSNALNGMTGAIMRSSGQ